MRTSLSALTIFGVMLIYTPASPAFARLQSAEAVPVARAPIRCPAEELSCGKQKPVLSDGVHRFTNDDMGLSVRFPKGSLVCMGRSGDAPRGFYSWLGMATNCRERASDSPPRYIGIYASWNALFEKLPGLELGWCKPLSASLAAHLGDAPLSFPGHKSAVCQRVSRHAIALTVRSLAGPRCEGAAAIEYMASFRTTSKRLDTDLKRFRTFLRQSKIGNVQVDC
jgi:hypothetical protein